MTRRAPIAEYSIPRWVQIECEVGPSYFDRAGELYESWRRYAHRQDIEPGSPPEFAAAMEKRGFTCDRLVGERNRIRWGLRLRRPIDQAGGRSKVCDPKGATPPGNTQNLGAEFPECFFSQVLRSANP